MVHARQTSRVREQCICKIDQVKRQSLQCTVSLFDVALCKDKYFLVHLFIIPLERTIKKKTTSVAEIAET